MPYLCAFLSRSSRRTSFAVFLTLVFAFCVRAQTFTGSIGGRVTDADGRVVAGAQVVVTEIGTNETSRTITNDLGEYVVSFLKPGVYQVSFTAQGFKETVESNLQLELNQSFRLNRTLTLGEVTQKIEVSADQTLLNYDSPEIAHVVGTEQLENIPELAVVNRGRSPFLLAKLIPGVTSTSSSNSNINNFSFGGGRPVTNEILIDGLPTTNPSDNTYTFTPSPDSIDEFKVITTPFSAEFGHTGGGVLLATSKHGTNEFHGSVYDYFRNRILNARSFFDGPNKTRYIQNDPGFTFGGPVLLPHYNGRNKTFFFADLNITLSATPASANSNGTETQFFLTPTDAERNGDFSSLLGAPLTASNGSPILNPCDGSPVLAGQIFDPLTARTVTVGGTPVVCRTAFANNVIPTQRLDSVGTQIAKFFPEPNGSFNGGAFNYRLVATKYQQTWQGLVRIDQNFGDNDKLFGRYGRYHPNTQAVNVINNAANTSNDSGWWDNQVGIGETHVFSPRIVNDFRLAFVQEINYDKAGGPPVPQLGLQGVPLTYFPTINMASYISLGDSGPDHDRDRSWVFNDVVQIQSGRHVLKVGGDFRRQMYHFYNGNQSPISGTYNFDNSFTSDGVDAGTGSDLADLLLGFPTQTIIQQDTYTYRENINSASLYFQDDFKLNQKLTLNLGLRWEFDGPYSEAANQFASFDPKLVNSQTGTPGAMQFAGVSGAPTHFMPNVYHDFLPRVGFAWNAVKDTVIRGGIGFYRLPNIGYFDVGPLSRFSQNSTFQSTDGVTPAYQLAHGVPQAPFLVDANGNPLVPADGSAVVDWIDNRARTPYNITWQFGVQRQFGSWFAELDYVASKGVKLPIEINADQAQPSQFADPNVFFERPYPQYAGIRYLTLAGNSNYQSLQAKLEHRWKNGLVVSAAYTFSKTLDDFDPVARVQFVGVQNIYNPRGEWGVAAYDIPQRFVANYVYQLPFGRGSKYGANTPVVKDLISGWEVSGITELQIGLPLAITQPNGNLAAGAGAQRPNITGSPVLSSGRTLDHWFSTAAFQVAPGGTLGDAPRFPLHGPGLNNTDFALQRNFILHERLKLQFRGEFFNVFNRAHFNNPDGNLADFNSDPTKNRFGVISGAQAGRITELVLRLFF